MNIKYIYLELQKLIKKLFNIPKQKIISDTVTAGSTKTIIIDSFLLSGFITKIYIAQNNNPEYAFRIWSNSGKTNLVYASGLETHINGFSEFEDKNVFEFTNTDTPKTQKLYLEIINTWTNSIASNFNIILEGKL